MSARPIAVAGVVLGLLATFVLDGTASGVALVVAAVLLCVAAFRALRGADMSGVAHGPPS